MKVCPACNTRYSDDSLLYCLQDGARLDSDIGTDSVTVVLPEIETSVRPAAGGGIRVPIAEQGGAGGFQSQVTTVAAPTPTRKGSGAAIALGLGALILLVIVAIMGLAAYVFYRNSQQAVAINGSDRSNANTVSSPAVTNAASTWPSVTPVRSPLSPSPSPAAFPSTTPPPAPPPPVLSSYPSTTRLKFARGAYTTSFSGDLNPRDSRSLVLACRAGQSLTANVSGGSSCVSISGGGASIRQYTRGGDNYITVVNNCSSVVRFSISISII